MTKLRFAPVVLCCSSCSSWLPLPSGGPGLPASESWMRCVLPHGFFVDLAPLLIIKIKIKKGAQPAADIDLRPLNEITCELLQR